MFDKKDPISMATITFAISFLLLIGMLYLAKPSWVQIVDQNSGKASISWQLVVAYSATFALVCAIAVLLIISKQRDPSTVNFAFGSSFPAPPIVPTFGP